VEIANYLYLGISSQSPYSKSSVYRMFSIGTPNLLISWRYKSAECSRQSVYYIRSNLQQFNSARAPPVLAGRRRIITPLMLEALCDHLLEKPSLYLDEMAVFLWDEFQIYVTTCSISRALTSIGWSKKTVRQKAKERNQDLRDSYVHYLSDFHSY